MVDRGARQWSVLVLDCLALAPRTRKLEGDGVRGVSVAGRPFSVGSYADDTASDASAVEEPEQCKVTVVGFVDEAECGHRCPSPGGGRLDGAGALQVGAVKLLTVRLVTCLGVRLGARGVR